MPGKIAIEEVEKFPVLKINGKDRSNTELTVAKEFLFTIFLNNRELVTMLCSPGNLLNLAFGFLALPRRQADSRG